jgi:hypothetical protein
VSEYISFVRPRSISFFFFFFTFFFFTKKLKNGVRACV